MLLDFFGKTLGKREGVESDFGFVLDWKMHKKNLWQVASTPFLVEAIIEKFKPIIICDQKTYNRNKSNLKYIYSLQP